MGLMPYVNSQQVVAGDRLAKTVKRGVEWLVEDQDENHFWVWEWGDVVRGCVHRDGLPGAFLSGL